MQDTRVCSGEGVDWKFALWLSYKITMKLTHDVVPSWLMGVMRFCALSIIYAVEGHHGNITSHLYVYDIFPANSTTHYLEYS
ncbi:hypothetical protein PMG11_04413 [Penicillium brasilianum]|uniref:Uncharacterized protein n=1 Tax=Penicillium brasilianum TaxID=104259 RepID=A0A0F7VCP7_PENBI|nr:hypothetical protein PMG11_04413 [Penicillium brasilianum]